MMFYMIDHGKSKHDTALFPNSTQLESCLITVYAALERISLGMWDVQSSDSNTRIILTYLVQKHHANTSLSIMKAFKINTVHHIALK